jgi:hypothetical protein
VWNIWSQGADEILQFIKEKEDNSQKYIALNGKFGIEKSRRKCKREGGILPQIRSFSDLEELWKLSNESHIFWVQVDADIWKLLN